MRSKFVGARAAGYRLHETASVATLAVLLAGFGTTARAQNAPTAPVEEVVVTGTHIESTGFQSPTPTMVMDSADIQAGAPSNLADYVNQLPALAGSTTPQNSNTSISAGTAGINALNLRSLGSSRTLVLLDGRRSPPSTVTGLVDINDIPQGLVKRVDVVTGGVSAVYGSDGVAGVVNFILDKTFTGLKGSIEGSETTYGDDPYRKLGLTYGQNFLGGRMHVLLSGEYVQRDGIYGAPRDWNMHGKYVITNPAYAAGNGQPQYLVTKHAGLSNATPGGIIVNTALRGTYFGVNGVPGQFAYGSQVRDPWMIGGDWQSVQVNDSQSLDPSDHRKGVFGRVSYAVTDHAEFYIEGAWNEHHSLGWTGVQFNQGNVTMQTDNAFLPQSVRDQAAALGITQFKFGTTNADLPIRKVNNTRGVSRLVVGGSGDFDLFGRNFKWDGYFQNGVTHTMEMAKDISNNARLALAQDAVFDGSGNIVCRSTLTDPANGCVPFNRFGIGVASQAGLDYVIGNPYRREHFEENVGAINLSTDRLLENWAGPISVAVGAEHRIESVSGFVPTQYQSGWFVGNYLPNFGSYQVNEAYAETLVPLMEGADFNGAVRLTDYSTSGAVMTWKAGLTYQPIDDLRFRLTESRDIRAPNLNELFASGTSRTNVLNDPNTGANIQFLEITSGNLALRPEVARTFGIGAVLTPTFIPGFGMSVDYYDIEVKGAIGSVSAQNVANRCFSGEVVYCSAITYGTAPDGSQVITQVNVQPFNFSQIKARGLDFEASYNVAAGDIVESWPGTFAFRLSATNYLEDYTNNGIDPPTDNAGQNAYDAMPPSLPHWLYRFNATYNAEPVTVSFIGHGVSAGKYSNAFVQCTSGCPLSTPYNTTINDNHIQGAFYLDTTVSYDFNVYDIDWQAFLSVQNVFDSDPVVIGDGPAGSSYGYAATNKDYYDFLGRVFKIGLRFNTP
jgi:outer membrane receptor protein involved in Fe transport